MRSEKLETVVQLRMNEDLRTRLQRLADFETRSLSQYIRLVLVRHIQDLDQQREELQRKKGGAK
jgi:predicted DNA-binding protein